MIGTKKCRHCLWQHLFLILTLLGIFLGFLIGLVLQSTRPDPDMLMWIGLIGELYLRVLKATMVPVTVCTVIAGTSTTDAKSSGKIGFVSISYIVITNIIGGIIGMILCLTIQPGAVKSYVGQTDQLDHRHLQTTDIIFDFFRNIFADNIVGAALQMSQTKYIQKEAMEPMMVSTDNASHRLGNESELWANATVKRLIRTVGNAGSTNILGLIVISAAFGIAASKVGPSAHKFTDFFKAGVHITFTIFDWIKWLTPIGVLSLIARALADIDDVSKTFKSMGWYILVVVGGNIFYQIVVLGTMFMIFTKSNPVKYFVNIANPWIMAFGPPSSVLPLPLLHRISTHVYNVDPRIADFVLPFSATLNRNGSTLFIAASCLFLAQYSGISLQTGTVVTIGLLTILSSLAVPNVPSSSVVIVIIILTSVGVPTTNIGIILALDWINDRARTTTNMMSHQIAVIVTWKLCQKSLRHQEYRHTDMDETLDIYHV